MISLIVYVLLLCSIAVISFFMNIFRAIIRLPYSRREKTFAFFHPFCDAGGGGERVLWRAIATLQQNFPNWTIVIYSDNYSNSNTAIVNNAQQRFGITVDASRIIFVRLRSCSLLKPFKFATLFVYIFGNFVIAVEALWRFRPAILIDTMGAPGVLPVFRFVGRCRVSSYIHYPIITSEMITVVINRKENINNQSWIAKSYVRTAVKTVYYYDVLVLYIFCVRRNNVIMTNGQWTNGHILEFADECVIVYPPCDVDELAASAGDSAKKVEHEFNRKKRVNILSVGQIRPEKNHYAQLCVFARVRELMAHRHLNLTLTILGGCRGEEDNTRLYQLKRLASSLFDFGSDIIWCINADVSTLRDHLHNSMIGLHTMHSEHFGISIVEGMAAGNIMVANDSGGPKLDIIGSFNEASDTPCGFLATDTEEYASHIVSIINKTTSERNKIRQQAKISCARFANEQFDGHFIHAIQPLFQ